MGGDGGISCRIFDRRHRSSKPSLATLLLSAACFDGSRLCPAPLISTLLYSISSLLIDSTGPQSLLLRVSPLCGVFFPAAGQSDLWYGSRLGELLDNLGLPGNSSSSSSFLYPVLSRLVAPSISWTKTAAVCLQSGSGWLVVGTRENFLGNF